MKHKDIYNEFQKLSQSEKPLKNPDAVWKQIEQKLDQKKDRGIVLPFKWMGIAASVLILLGLGWFVWQDNQNSSTAITQQEVGPPENTIESTQEYKEETTPHELTIEKESQSSTVEKVPLDEWKQQEVYAYEDVESKKKSFKKVSNNTIKNEELFMDADGVRDESKIQLNKRKELDYKEKNYTATVIDPDGNPMPDAMVFNINSGENTITDFDGFFSINADKNDKILVESYDGEEKELYAFESSTIQMNNAQAQELQQLVVTAYSVPPTNNYSTSISANDLNQSAGYINPNNVILDANAPRFDNSDYVVSSPEFDLEFSVESEPQISFSKALQGKLAGVDISQSTGQPGSTDKVKIRGISSISNKNNPLIIVDGAPISNNDTNYLATLDTQKVHSVSVLKDASATAIYGSRGANGVIIINTHKQNLSKKEIRKARKEARKLKKLQKKGELILMTDAPIVSEVEVETPIFHKIPISQEEYSSFIENAFTTPISEPLSTFSIDVDRASYSNVRRHLNNGQSVPKDAVRVEEMINYFDYNYPQPTNNHPFEIFTEYGDSPWNPTHKLLKIGMQAQQIPIDQVPASNLVFLIDVSGSMSDANKLPLLKKSYELLVKNLRKKDKVSIVVYAGAAGVVLNPTNGNEKTTLLDAINQLSAGGSTAGGAGIELAYTLAQENFIKDGNNRVILATDGDFNVGISNTQELEDLIEEKRKSGVFLTCLGFGMGNYKDNNLETLADKGNGNYAYIDNLQEAQKFLVKEFSGTLYTLAKDVKIQIEFNPQWVKAYRLIGYENRLLNPEDFNNDAIDAGELGAGHTVTALYEIIPVGIENEFTAPLNTPLKYQENQVKTDYSQEMATLKCRYKKPDEDQSILFTQVVSHTALKPSELSEDYIFASGVAWFGLKLRDSEYVSDKKTEDILQWIQKGIGEDKEGFRKELIRLIELVE